MRTRSFITGMLATCLVIATSPARAEMIGTPQLLAPAAQAAQRERVSTFLARADVQQQLVAMGVDPTAAASRVAGMTDQELQSINDKIDSLPAGAGAVELLLIIILILIILELAGVIDIFKRI